MEQFLMKKIGTIVNNESESGILLDSKYIPAITGLDQFGDIQIIWVFDQVPESALKGDFVENKPYKKGPERIGAFATRTPVRPNRIGLSCATITYIDYEKGFIGLGYIDALEGTPVLDIKPYTPSADRIENPITPAWCSHWPKNVETSGEFDWAAEFNF